MDVEEEDAAAGVPCRGGGAGGVVREVVEVVGGLLYRGA